MESQAFAVVMAGGSGTRLWPMSTEGRPKQLLALDGSSLIRETVARLRPLFPLERISIVTVRNQAEAVREHLPEIRPENVIEEPLGRDTAPCIGLAAVHLKRIHPAAVMVALPADHYIEEAGRFRQALTSGIRLAQQGHLVTLGIVPDRPAAGYGYIEAGEYLSESQHGLEAMRVERFIEKPSLEDARRLLETPNHYWNSGIFIWQVERILEELAEHMPALYRGLEEIEESWDTLERDGLMGRIYGRQEAMSIDRGVMQKASRTVVIPVEMGWSDLGDWSSVTSVLEKDGNGNAVRA